MKKSHAYAAAAPTVWFALVLLLSAAAVAASALLLVDYVRPAPVFCAEDGGCGALKETIFARPFGIPTPVFGLSGFLAIGFLALVRGRAARVAQAVLASVGGVVALFLLWVQWRLSTLCPYCAVVDTSGVLLMGLCVARAGFGWDPPPIKRLALGGSGALVLALAVPIAIGAVKRPIPHEVPAAIAAEMKKTPSGKVTVVDFIDFECPFCRMTHKELVPVLAEYKDKVRVVRKQVPLRMHPHAMDAARAACCAELLGKGDEMAEALVDADASELTPEGCEKIAEKLGLDVARFRACVQDPQTDARIRADMETFRASQGKGLPMLWIGDTKIVGAQDKETLRAALDDAVRRL